MPTKRTRISRCSRQSNIDPAVLARLTGTPLPEGANRFLYSHPSNPAGDWKTHRETILPLWQENHPGTRPPAWWLYDAQEQRQRIGGKGTPCHEVLAYVAAYRLGIPFPWVSDWSIDYYNGRTAGNISMKTNYREGDFIAERFDPTDPPVFESQAAYLKRLKLLSPGESARLTLRDFKPEELPEELWPE